MRINFFCPLPPAPTEIAQHLLRILPGLAAACDLTLWTSAPDWDKSITRHAPVIAYNPATIDTDARARSGHNVYNIGNSIDLHGDIWDASRVLPGTLILHDATLFEFAGGYFRVRHRSRDRLIDSLRAHDGEAAVQDYEAYERGTVTLDEMCRKYPQTSLVCACATAVLIHNEAVRPTLALPPHIPVAVAQLPYAATARPIPPRDTSAPHRLIMFGYIGANRCLAEALDALATDDIRPHFTLDIYGRVSIEPEIRATIARLGLADRVTLHGFVDDATLDRALDTADLALVLRNPSMREASASVLRAWDHELPCIVSHTSWYATLPPQTVLSCPPGDETAALCRHLRAFLADPAPARAAGSTGRARLADAHAPSRYVAALLALCAEAREETAPASRHLLDRVERELAPLGAAARHPAFLAGLGNAIAAITPDWTDNLQKIKLYY